MELSFIAQEILEAAFRQLEDAEYEGHARVFVGDTMLLVDRDDFEDLRNDIIRCCQNIGDEIRLKDFSSIVNEEG